MKRSWLIAFLLFFSACLAAETPWQYGRIVDVKRSVTSYTKAWVVNTPISEERTIYRITVDVGNGRLIGDYELSSEQAEPPQDWTPGYAVKVQLAADSMDLRAPTGNLRLHITQRKNSATPMPPLTAEEKKRLAEMEEPAGGMIGFSERTPDAARGKGSEQATAADAAPASAPPPAPPTAGTVTVRSTPYLSEVFVDGDSMGYTPAKINLPPGKHTFRVEKQGYKPWKKEMSITIGSELTLDATLEKK